MKTLREELWPDVLRRIGCICKINEYAFINLWNSIENSVSENLWDILHENICRGLYEDEN